MTLESKTSYNLDELQNLKLDFAYDEIISNLKNDKCEDFIKIFNIRHRYTWKYFTLLQHTTIISIHTM